MARHAGTVLTVAAAFVVAGVLYTVDTQLINKPEKPRAEAAAPSPSSIAPSTVPLAPPSASPTPPGGQKGTYAGETDGGSAGIAIAMNGGQGVAYVCDGKAEAWVNGAADDGQLALSGKKGTLTGRFTNGVATGTVTAGNRTYHFTVKLAQAPSGLYRSAAAVRNRLDASWVVTPDGRQFGLATNPDGTSVAAPGLDPVSLTANGLPVVSSAL
jgi:hypothetical protein